MISLLFGIGFGVIVFSLFYALATYLVAFFSNSCIGLIKIFGKVGRRHKNGEKFTWNKDKFSIIPRILIIFDLEEHGKVKKIRLTIGFLILLLGIIYTFVIMYFFWGIPKFVPKLLCYSAIYSVTCIIYSNIILIYSYIKGDELQEFTWSQKLKIKNGATFEQLNMSIPEGMFEKSSKDAQVGYLYLCFSRSLWMKNFSALNNIVRQLDVALRKHGEKSEYSYDVLTVGGYYDILFYSTYVNPNQSHAVRIYNMIKQTLEADMDPDGRRVLAYYQFYIMNQPQLASITLNQAIEAVYNADTTIFSQAELNLERRLIEELQDNMTRVLNPGTFTKPVIENTFDDAPII